MRRWYVNENALMSGPFGRSSGVVYVPDEDDVEKVAKVLWERDDAIWDPLNQTTWEDACPIEREEYIQSAREAMRILGILG